MLRTGDNICNMGTRMALNIWQLLLNINIPLKKTSSWGLLANFSQDLEQDALVMNSQALKGTVCAKEQKSRGWTCYHSARQIRLSVGKQLRKKSGWTVGKGAVSNTQKRPDMPCTRLGWNKEGIGDLNRVKLSTCKKYEDTSIPGLCKGQIGTREKKTPGTANEGEVNAALQLPVASGSKKGRRWDGQDQRRWGTWQSREDAKSLPRTQMSGVGGVGRGAAPAPLRTLSE